MIAGNGIGILIGGEGTEVFSNAIGVESNRVSPVPNFIGIRIEQGDGSLIGGAPARGNVIARNLTAGVVVAGRSGFPEPQGHSILGNRMFRNFDPATFDPQPGIDLGDDGVTTNDLVDADPGPNGFQNHPVLTSVTRFIDNTFFEGSLHARPGRTYRIELYSTSTPHPSSHCEGEFFIGSVDVTADANGNALFPDPLGFPVASPGILFTATATDVLSGDTSEFGPCFQANGLPGTDVSLTKTSDELVVAPGSSVTFLVTVHNRGPGEVSSLEVVDLLPAGLDWQTHLASQGSYDPGTGVWDVGDVPAPDEAHPEQVATLEIQALVTAAGGTLTNVAAIPPQGLFDADLGDNSAEVNLEVRTGADVELSHSVSPPAADVGGELAFTLTVRNKGPEDATGVKVFGFLPEELGAPVADAPETVGFRASDGLWTWDVGDLARDAARILVLRATVEERSFEDLTHTASALVGAPGDEAPENNLRSVRFGIGRATDLKIDFLTGRIVGSNVIWTIGISNDGPDDSLGFVLDAAVIGQDLEALPGGGTVPGLDCFLTPGPPFRTVTCNFVLPPFDGVLAAGQSVEGDFAVSPLGGDAPAIGVKIETGDFDPDFGNNQKFSAFGIDCFIATAAFGSVLDPHVQALRDFRDAHLLTNAPGRAFVRAYYALSPPLAAVIAEHPTLRTAVRLGLAPLLLGVAHPRAAAAGGIVAVLIAGTGWTLRGRRRSIS